MEGLFDTVAAFLVLWKAYPKKQKMAAAKKAFYAYCNKIGMSDNAFATMLTSLDAQKESEQWKNKKFIPLLENWLKGERWEDEVEVVTSSAEPSEYVPKRYGESQLTLQQLTYRDMGIPYELPYEETM